MNRAGRRSLQDALRDFHTPEQNVVFADTEGNIGFVAAGRVPTRRNITSRSIFPAPGWTARYEWNGSLPSKTCRSSTIHRRQHRHREQRHPPARYFKFIGHTFDRPYRRDRIPNYWP